MDKIRKIWKDPVWSKVIATTIISLVAVIYSYILSKIKNESFESSLIALLTYKIQLWFILFIAIIGLSVNLILKKSKKKFVYDDETLKIDREIFERIRIKLLPQEGSISFLRYHSFSGSFKNSSLENLDKFEYESKKSDFEFLNPELESLKKSLNTKIANLTLTIGFETWSLPNDRQSIPKEWQHEQPERFRMVVNELNTTAREICSVYDELIKNGRRILKV